MPPHPPPASHSAVIKPTKFRRNNVVMRSVLRSRGAATDTLLPIRCALHLADLKSAECPLGQLRWRWRQRERPILINAPLMPDIRWSCFAEADKLHPDPITDD